MRRMPGHPLAPPPHRFKRPIRQKESHESEGKIKDYMTGIDHAFDEVIQMANHREIGQDILG